MSKQKIKPLKPKSFPNHHIYNTTIESVDIEPTCYTQAIKYSHWRQAMGNELTALTINAT
jgi:hypothetical protein